MNAIWTLLSLASNNNIQQDIPVKPAGNTNMPTNIHPNEVNKGPTFLNDTSYNEGSDEKAGLTIFHSDMKLASNEVHKLTVPGSVPIYEQSIPDVLGRPMLVTPLTWTTAHVSNTKLYTLSSVYSLITSTPLWADKIRGFENIRGTVCFRLTMNANPFQQGALIMSFNPLGPHVDPNNSRNYLKSQSTQLPNVIISCRDGVGLLKVPYYSPSQWYNVKTGLFDWGSLTIKVFSPMQTGSSGETTVSLALNAWFEDFELAAPLVPQMAAPKRKIVSKKVGREAEAERAASTGVVSSLLAGVSRVADAVTEHIPSLATFSEPVSWIASAGSQVASWFGWSKPATEVVPQVVSMIKDPYMATSSGVSNASILALRHDNGIEVSDAFSPEQYDEMSFDFIKRRYQWITTVNWLDTGLDGDSLWSQYVDPFAFGEQFTITHGTHTVTGQNFPPFSHISRGFKYYRGSIKLKLKIFKTEFHTGRLQITYTPSANYTTAPSVTTGLYSLREIIDIRGKNEFEFVLPFLYNKPWAELNTNSTGKVDIVILNQLRHPETASNSINFEVFVSAGDDFELASPINVINQSYIPQMDSGRAIPDPEPSKVSDIIGGNKYRDETDRYYENRHSMGEVFTSLRQLCLRYNPVLPTVVPSALPIDIAPWFFQTATMDTGGTFYQPAAYDAVSYIASGYLFCRGSMRMALSIDTSTTDEADIVFSMCPYNGTTGFTNASTTFTNHANWIQHTEIPLVVANRPYVEIQRSTNPYTVQIPYYSSTFVIPIQHYPQQPMLTQPPMLVVGSNNGGSAPDFIYRAVGDDFSFSYFLGFYPVLFTYV